MTSGPWLSGGHRQKTHHSAAGHAPPQDSSGPREPRKAMREMGEGPTESQKASPVR